MAERILMETFYSEPGGGESNFIITTGHEKPNAQQKKVVSEMTSKPNQPNKATAMGLKEAAYVRLAQKWARDCHLPEPETYTDIDDPRLKEAMLNRVGMRGIR